MEDFQRINKEMNITILLNIHHVELALTYASRVVGIRAGQIVYDGPVSDVNEEILNNIYEGKLEQEGGRMSLYDKVFPPKKMTISNGKTIEKPASRLPLSLRLSC